MHTHLDSCLIKKECFSALVEFNECPLTGIINLFVPKTNIWHDRMNYTIPQRHNPTIVTMKYAYVFLQKFLLIRFSCSVVDSLSPLLVIFFLTNPATEKNLSIIHHSILSISHPNEKNQKAKITNE